MIRFALPALMLIAAAGIAQPPAGSDVVIVPPSAPEAPIQWLPIKGDARVNSDITISFGGVKGKAKLADPGASLRNQSDGKGATIRHNVAGPVRIVIEPEGGGEPLYRSVNLTGDPAPPVPNPLRDRIKAAYEADGTPNKAERAKDLAALYKQAAVVAENPDVATGGELVRRVKDASALILKPDDLVGVRRQVAVELAAVLGEDGPLAAEHRRDVARLFRDLAAILEGMA